MLYFIFLHFWQISPFEMPTIPKVDLVLDRGSKVLMTSLAHGDSKPQDKGGDQDKVHHN
jgi:hypothetical protein